MRISRPILRRYLTGYAFIVPTAILVFLWFYIPVIWTTVLSFQEWDGFQKPEWVFLKNYVEMIGDKVAMKAIFNSVTMAIVQTAGAVIVGVAVAFLIYTVNTREGAVLRLIFFAPSMIPTAITGMLFVFVYNFDIGILNNLFRAIGLEGLVRAWLTDFSTVIGSINIVNIYKNAGLTMLLTYASLMMIPSTLIEAVKIEGGGYFTIARRVLLPLVRPIIVMSTIYTLTLSFKTYSLVFTLTRGGPANYSKTVPIYMSETAFSYGEFGYSAALGVIITIIIILIISLGRKFTSGETYEF